MMTNHLFTGARASLIAAGALAVAAIGVGCGAPHGCGPSPTVPCASSALSVSYIYPTAGPTESEVDVRIYGNGFQPGATVTFDGAPTTSSVVNAHLITVTVPPHPAGSVDIVVTSAGGQTGRLVRAFTFVPMTVTSVSPATGLPGDLVTITGAGLLPGATVTFDGIQAIVLPSTLTVITATVPIHATGVVDVVVTNPRGQSVTRSAAYTYAFVSIAGSPGVVAAGGQLSVSWTAPSGRTNGDWVALFKVGDPDTAYRWWAYTEDAASGTLTLAAPAEPGQYEFRYLANYDFIAVARSSPITVTGLPG